MIDFVGVKIALINNNQILIIQRDDKPSITDPGMWDLPGGGRENTETPFDCIEREVKEELGIKIKQSSILWAGIYPSIYYPKKQAYFMVARIGSNDLSKIKFGDEGQCWKMISINDFMKDPAVISAMKLRFKDYLERQTD